VLGASFYLKILIANKQNEGCGWLLTMLQKLAAMLLFV
jgi:hypothetical protein